MGFGMNRNGPAVWTTKDDDDVDDDDESSLSFEETKPAGESTSKILLMDNADRRRCWVRVASSSFLLFGAVTVCSPSHLEHQQLDEERDDGGGGAVAVVGRRR
jgi:hypothetical protein